MLKWTFRIIGCFIVGSLLLVMAYRFINPPTTVTMIASWAQGKGARRDWMPLDEMDPNMARAAIAAEDSRFCSHWGFDLEAIEKAFARNRNSGRIRGGSTISQQTAKNAFLWQGRSWLRKGLEVWFTLLIESFWPKHRIMEVYLNLAETGIGTFGANAGAQRYFRHSAARLSATEAARIAAVLPLPKKRAAITPAGFTRRYGNNIVRRMAVVQRGGLDRCLR